MGGMRRRAKLLSITSLLITSIVGVVVCSGAGALSFQSSTSPDNHPVSIGFSFNPTITISFSSTNLTIPSLTPTTATPSDAITVDVATNTLGGFKLSASTGNSSNNGSTSLIHSSNSNLVFSSIATDANIAIGSLNNNTWGYSTCIEGSEANCNNGDGATGWSNYNGLPAYTSATPTELLDIAPGSPAVSNGSIKFRIAAKASDTQASGTYTNTINFTAITKPLTTSYTINYIDNSTEGTNIPIEQTGTIIEDSELITLSSTIPTRSGYRFKGWCTTSTNDSTCSGTTYRPSDDYVISNVGGIVDVNLYAIWGLPTINDIEYLQDFAISPEVRASIIESMMEEQTYTKKDKRDEQNYTIAKLKDGKVWMTKNLNLAGGTALDVDNTDVDASYIESFTTSNNLTKTGNTIVLPASSTSGFNSDNYSFVFNSQSETCGNNSPCYSYYSWDAATLGSGRNIDTDNTDAPYSICPKGWKLPTSRTTAATDWQTESDFYALAHQYGLDSTTSTSESDNGFYMQAGPGTVPNFLLAGYYYGGSFRYGGSDGAYWSSTSRSSSFLARYLYFLSSYVDSAYELGRRGGFSVRCLAE